MLPCWDFPSGGPLTDDWNIYQYFQSYPSSLFGGILCHLLILNDNLAHYHHWIWLSLPISNFFLRVGFEIWQEGMAALHH
jgi:hypothetical protein